VPRSRALGISRRVRGEHVQAKLLRIPLDVGVQHEGESSLKRRWDTRYIDIREVDKLDEAQMATWVKQAAASPGWVP
jgi:hypothetical protein